MARKASPTVQYSKLFEAMGRLSPELRIMWIRNYLDNFDKKSLLMGGIVEGLDLYYQNTFGKPIGEIPTVIPDPEWQVGESPMITADLIDMAYGFNPQVVTAEEAVLVLENQGFIVKSLKES